MQASSYSDVQRMLGSFNANWRPLRWMANEGTVGLDLASSNYFHLCRLNQCPPQSATARIGNVNDNRQNNRNFSAKVASTSSWNAKPWANLKTTLGARLHESRNRLRQQHRTELPPGATTVARGDHDHRERAAADGHEDARRLRAGSRRRSATACSSRSRLARTRTARSARTSSASSIRRPAYRGSCPTSRSSRRSWTSLSQFRVRASYGASGVQPGRTQGLVTFAPGTVTIDGRSSTTGTDTPVVERAKPGQREPQARAVRRVRDGIRDVLAQQSRPPRLHLLSKEHARRVDQRADRSVRGCGRYEPAPERRLDAELRTRIAAQRTARRQQAIRLGRDLTASHNTALIVDLGIDPSTGVAAHHWRRRAHGATRRSSRSTPSGTTRTPTADANHDGVLQVSEVHVDSSFKNYGNAIPRDLSR